jgi:hypothetical protein
MRKTTLRPIRVAVAASMLLALPAASASRPLAAASQPESEAAVDEEWAAAAAGLVRRCDKAGHADLAAVIRGWQLPPADGRQFVLAIPPRTVQPEWIDAPDERAIWDDFLAARRTRAAGILALALAAARADGDAAPSDGRPRPTAGGPTEAVRLLYVALRDDPDNQRAREAGGWVRRQGEWLWPEAARRLDDGEEHSDEFGWLPRGRQDRYRDGDRYERGRWVKAEAQKVPVDPSQGWKFSSDHWQITSTAGMTAAATLAAGLEDTHAVWRQVFGGYQFEPAEWERRLAGRGRTPAGGRPPAFAATLVADRERYVAALERLEPAIARTQGIYWTPTRTAWFFEGEGQSPTTVHHEATHQLFAEMRRTSPLAGERCGFWAIEAAACYMESLEPTEFGWTVGGRDAGRAVVARERLLEDAFHVPLAELTALGRRDFQADERLPQIYSEISGLADFFMNGEGGRYRAAFVEYLTRVYTGTVDPDTLARLCKKGYDELDDDYRRHMAR